MEAITLPSGRKAYKQTDEDTYSIYGPDDKTFITSISVKDMEILTGHFHNVNFSEAVNTYKTRCSECGGTGVLLSLNGEKLCDECNIKQIEG